MSYELELISLRCNKTQEIKSEPYLMVNHYVEWGPLKIDTGVVELIDKRIGFEHDINIELHESNPHDVPHRKDDYIGTMNLSESKIQSLASGLHSPQKYDFYDDSQIVGSISYTLIYDLHKV